jgi:general secretion pathway protein G
MNKGSSSNSSGFTIVELLVVIVVIGILAAITIVSYTGITKRAAEATLKSDLGNAVTQLGIDNVTNSTYPLSVGDANGGKGLSKSAGTNYFYNRDYNSYCLSANSSAAGSSIYHVTNVGSLLGGDCNYTQSLLTNLIAYWKMDETNGLAVYDSVGSANGTVTGTGAVNNQIGKINTSYSFDITKSGYINVPHIDLDGTPFSIAYWQNSTYSTQVGDPGVIASANSTTRNFNIINRVGNHLASFRTWDESSGDNTLLSSTPVEDSSWHHVVCVVTGTQKLIYVDGVLDNQVSWAHYLKPDPNSLRIGNAIFNGIFNGSLDEIGIWTRALSPTEVSTLYNSGTGLQYP